MKYHRRLASALAIVLGTYACTSMHPATSSSDVRLRIEPTAAAPGDSVALVLDNGSAEIVGYNLCTTTLDRRSGEAWEPVASDRVCTMELRMLQPGQEARITLALPADLAPGEYRAVTGVERMDAGERTGVATEPFQVR